VARGSKKHDRRESKEKRKRESVICDKRDDREVQRKVRRGTVAGIRWWFKAGGSCWDCTMSAEGAVSEMVYRLQGRSEVG
jgi:hypothetical protein